MVNDPRWLPVSVSPAQISRALSFIQDLTWQALERDYPLVPTEKGLALKVDDEPVRLAFIEKTERVRHELTEEELAALAKWEVDRERRTRRGDLACCRFGGQYV